MSKEIWTSAKYQGIDSKGKYLVSNFGRILSFSRRGKYEFICTSKRRQTFSFSTSEITVTAPLARVILCSFYGFVFSKNEVADHINNDPTDNRISNLQKITIKENLNKDKKPNTNPNRYLQVVSKSNRYNWKVQMGVSCSSRSLYLGMFETKKQAIEARDLIEGVISDNINLGTAEVRKKALEALRVYRDSVYLPPIKKHLRFY